jgi:hypothetical protein
VLAIRTQKHEKSPVYQLIAQFVMLFGPCCLKSSSAPYANSTYTPAVAFVITKSFESVVFSLRFQVDVVSTFLKTPLVPRVITVFSRSWVPFVVLPSEHSYRWSLMSRLEEREMGGSSETGGERRRRRKEEKKEEEEEKEEEKKG